MTNALALVRNVSKSTNSLMEEFKLFGFSWEERHYRIVSTDEEGVKIRFHRRVYNKIRKYTQRHPDFSDFIKLSQPGKVVIPAGSYAVINFILHRIADELWEKFQRVINLLKKRLEGRISRIISFLNLKVSEFTFRVIYCFKRGIMKIRVESSINNRKNNFSLISPLREWVRLPEELNKKLSLVTQA